MKNQIKVVNSDEKFESDDISYTKAVIGEMITLNNSEQKVLSLIWDSMEDELSISFEKVVMLSDSLLPSKHNLLKLSASIFSWSHICGNCSIQNFASGYLQVAFRMGYTIATKSCKDMV